VGGFGVKGWCRGRGGDEVNAITARLNEKKRLEAIVRDGSGSCMDER
jgi:hypothetical protein